MFALSLAVFGTGRSRYVQAEDSGERCCVGKAGVVARFELTAQLDSILTFAKLQLALLGAFAFLALGLLVAGAQNSHQVNTQGIAYILLAKHYDAGNFGLAVSSYWSPLLSWLLALDLKAGWGDLAALLVVVVVSLAGFAWVAGWQKAREAPAKGLRGQAAVALAVMSPWWIVLSPHYGSPTIGSV